MCTSPNSFPSRSIQAVGHEELQQLQQQQRKTRRVSFDGSVRVWPYLHKNDLSAEERANTWYTKFENLNIQEECSRTVQLHYQGKIHKDSSSWCFRGLEFRTSEGAALRRNNKYLAWDTVLNLQESQYLLGDFDADIIAHRYQAVCAVSMNSAIANALQDAEAAAEHQRVTPLIPFNSSSNFGTLNAPSKNATLAPRARRTVFNIAVPMRHQGASAAA